MKPKIWIVDTSVLLNILNIPGRNQNRDEVIKQFEERIKNEDEFFVPYTTIIETGNPIGKLPGNQKYEYAEKFNKMVKSALEGKAPWKPLKFPTVEDVLGWLNGNDFPVKASNEVGFGDYSIIKQWEEQVQLLKSYSVEIWTLDTPLEGYCS